MDRVPAVKELTLIRIPLSEMIRNADEATPRRIGATADYGLVNKHFDLVAAARAAGLKWRMIAASAEFAGLEAANQEKILSSYFNIIQRNRIKTAGKAALKAASTILTQPAPARPAVIHRPLPPPPPGSAPAAIPGDIFDSLPALSTARKAF